MHDLAVINRRNLEEQGRALAHAEANGNHERAASILAAAPSVTDPGWDTFADAYVRAIEEG